MRVFFIDFQDHSVLRKLRELGAELNDSSYPVVEVIAPIPEMRYTSFKISDDAGRLWKLTNDEVVIHLNSEDRYYPENHVYGIHEMPHIPGLVEKNYLLIDISNDEENQVLDWVPASEVKNPKFF